MGIFLKFGSIEGDATLQDHVGWVEALSVDWSGAARLGHGGGAHTGRSAGSRVAYEPVTLTKNVDSASVPLMKAMAHNDIIDQVKLHVTTSREGQPANISLEIVFSQARITHVGLGLTSGASSQAVSFYYNRFEVTYFNDETGAGRHSFTDTLSPNG